MFRSMGFDQYPIFLTEVSKNKQLVIFNHSDLEFALVGRGIEVIKSFNQLDRFL